MADTKISALTDGTAPEDTDIFPVARGAANRGLAWSTLVTAIGAQAKVDAHVNDAADAHNASAISIADAGGDFTATDVEAALAELQADAETDASALTTHIADSDDAHNASAISVLDTAANFTGTDVEAVLAELQDNIDADGGGGGGITKARATGRYYTTVGQSDGDATIALTLNRAYYNAFPVTTAITIDRLSLGVSSAGGAGSVVRPGIYTTDADGYPDSLVLDAGTIDGTSATYQEITISQALSANTLYWFAAVWQVGTAGSVRALGVGTGSEWISMASNAQDPRAASYTQDSVTGALPASATPSTVAGVTSSIAGKYRVA